MERSSRSVTDACTGADSIRPKVGQMREIDRREMAAGRTRESRVQLSETVFFVEIPPAMWDNGITLIMNTRMEIG